MRRQRGLGLVELAIVLGLALAVVAALYGLYRRVDGAGYERGQSTERALWQGREARQQADYGRELKRLGEVALAGTQQGATDTAAAVHKLNREHADELAQKDADLVAFASGALVFHDPGRAACGAPGGGAKSEVAADPSRADPGGAELSQPLARFLDAEAIRADGVVAKYNAALALLESDREVCR